jgi:putative uncharacterized protein (fragment)
VALVSLKNFEGAIENLDAALEADPRSGVALMARGYARYAQAMSRLSINRSEHEEKSDGDSPLLARQTAMKELSDAVADFDAALALNPRLVYAVFNKGAIHYFLQDFASAIQCYTKAVEIDPDFGEAYFNRGLAYLKTGDKQRAFADLSKAGELGIVPSYNLLKRMK